MSSSITPTNSSVSTTAANGKAQSFYVAEPAWAETFRLTIQVVLAFTRLVGNVLVCLVITLQPKMKTVVNCLIRNLAIADICILVFSFPVGVIREQAKYRWPLGEFACRGVHPMVDMFYGVSVWSIVIIAIDRYKAIVWVARPKKKNERSKLPDGRWPLFGSFHVLSFHFRCTLSRNYKTRAHFMSSVKPHGLIKLQVKLVCNSTCNRHLDIPEHFQEATREYKV